MTDTTELECVACGKTKHTDDETDNLCECGGPMSKAPLWFFCLKCSFKTTEPYSPLCPECKSLMGCICKCDRCGYEGKGRPGVMCPDCGMAVISAAHQEAHTPERASIAGADPMPASQLTPPRMGWVCSKCERSLAPSVEECPCSVKGYTKADIQI